MDKLTPKDICSVKRYNNDEREPHYYDCNAFTFCCAQGTKEIEYVRAHCTNKTRSDDKITVFISPKINEIFNIVID